MAAMAQPLRVSKNETSVQDLTGHVVFSAMPKVISEKPVSGSALASMMNGNRCRDAYLVGLTAPVRLVFYALCQTCCIGWTSMCKYVKLL